MFNSETDTNDWDLEDDNELVWVESEYLENLQEDSKLLYALRKIGAVPLNIEEEAIEFLKEEGMEDEE